MAWENAKTKSSGSPGCRNGRCKGLLSLAGGTPGKISRGRGSCVLPGGLRGVPQKGGPGDFAPWQGAWGMCPQKDKSGGWRGLCPLPGGLGGVPPGKTKQGASSLLLQPGHEWDPERRQTPSQRGWEKIGVQGGAKPPCRGAAGCVPPPFLQIRRMAKKSIPHSQFAIRSFAIQAGGHPPFPPLRGTLSPCTPCFPIPRLDA